MEAIKAVIAERPTPKDPVNADLVFALKYGQSLSKDLTTITHEIGKLLEESGFRRVGLNFLGLKHTFRSITDATRDFPSVRQVMGNADASIDDVCREHIDDAHFVAVAEHVRTLLFGKQDNGTTDDKTDANECAGYDEMADNIPQFESDSPRLKQNTTKSARLRTTAANE